MLQFKNCGHLKVWTAALSPCLTPSTTESASGVGLRALISAELGQSMVLSMIGKEEGLSASLAVRKQWDRWHSLLLWPLCSLQKVESPSV